MDTSLMKPRLSSSV